MRYTHGHHASVLASHGRRTASNSCAYLLPHLRPGMTLLDVGCGPGSITLDLAEVVAPGRVVAIEPVEDPLATAREEAARRGDTTTVFQLGDVMHLPFEDDSFDVVHAHQVLQHLTDPVAALREMGRVLRPGGLVAVRDVDYEVMRWYPPSPHLDRWLAVYRQVARANGAEPDAGRHLRAWVHEADLVQLESGASTWCYATAEETRWWGDSQADRVLASAWADQSREQGLTDDDLTQIADAWRAWGEHPDAWFAMLHADMLATVPASTTGTGAETT